MNSRSWVVTSIAPSAWFQAAKFYSHFAPAFPRQLARQEARQEALAGAQRLQVGVGILFGPAAFAGAISLNRFLKAKIDRFYALTAAGKAPGVAIDRR